MPRKGTRSTSSTRRSRSETPSRTLAREARKTKRTVRNNLGPKGDGTSAPQRNE